MVKTCLILFLVMSLEVIPQEQQEISARKSELSELKDEIKRLEQEIKDKSRTEKKTFETLEKIKRQVYIVNRMVISLRNDERQKDVEIANTTGEIVNIEKNISALKENYSKSILGLYKYGKPSELDLMLNSENVNQALLRKEYLERFSRRRESDIAVLRENVKTLAVLRTRLEKERTEKSLLAKEKSIEESRLKVKITDNTRLITEIKKNKSELKKEIDSRKKAEIKIKSLIEKLIADAERKRKEELNRIAELDKKKKGGEKVDDTEYHEFNLKTAGLASFRGMKGKLNWPVTSGKIIGKFGENTHRLLKTVTLNYGIDIQTSKNSDIKCVADGIISAIDWIPGYGSVIIVTHSEEFRTVYSRLSEIYVSEGEKVPAGRVIAKVAESLEGSILHFEIWNSRINQNPEIWLSRK